jgi:hypothetical protein
MKKSRLIKILSGMILGFPAALYFSYHPVITVGGSESMNLELSLALLYLVVFDVVSFVALIREKKLAEIFKKPSFLVLPIFITMSVFWSQNIVRGALTAVMLWAVYFAIRAIVVFREEIFVAGFKEKFLKWFFGASLLACAWCYAQSLMDVFGVAPSCTLLCRGCVNNMFGFPHPNGFAVEPQFMGNLLLLPTLVSAWLLVRKCDCTKRGLLWFLFFVFSSTLFLTFSRGAIYALAAGLLFFTVYYIVKQKNAKVMILWPVLILSFLFTLNAQGVMAELSPTDDTYLTGVSKVINQLSLGIIKINVEKPSTSLEEGGEVENKDSANGGVGTGASVGTNGVDNSAVTSVYDGYVEESTNIRMALTSSALKVWRKDFTTAMFGVGIGGAGEAMYVAGETGSPKEIVQNEYASLLLEIGAVGAMLVFVTMAAVLRLVKKLQGAELLMTLFVAFGVTLFFFSGLPNALHIYLVPAILGLLRK